MTWWFSVEYIDKLHRDSIKFRSRYIGTSGFLAATFDLLLPATSYYILVRATGLPILENIIFTFSIRTITFRSGDVGTFDLSAAILDFLLPVTSYYILVNATGLLILKNMVFAIEIVILSSLKVKFRHFRFFSRHLEC